MDLLSDTQNWALRMRRECRERFPRHWLQRNLLDSDPGMHQDTCVTHVPWCMSGSLTRGGGENVPDIPGACATRNFTNLARGPWHRLIEAEFAPGNYVNPVCCVAIVCHQVRCMYWGHLGHIHRAISHLKWYKIACMRYLACIFSQMKSINMFSMYFAIWSSQTFHLEIYCGLNI